MIRDFTKGIVKENPLFVIVLGLCPALAVTTQVNNALGMGAGVIFVLLGSNLFVSLLKDFIPEKIRIPSYIVIIASFVTIVEMLMKAYIPALFKSLGIFIPLIVVNCVILGRAEAFANKHPVSNSVMDALGMGVGFTIGLVLIALIREVFGSGTITLFPIGGFNGVIKLPTLPVGPMKVFTLATGAMLVMGYIKAFLNWLESRQPAGGKDADVPPGTRDGPKTEAGGKDADVPPGTRDGPKTEAGGKDAEPIDMNVGIDDKSTE